MSDQPSHGAPGDRPTPLGAGYQHPQIAGSYPSAPAPEPALPTDAYTSWLTRVLAVLIDAVPALLLLGIGIGLYAGTFERVCITDSSDFDLGEFCADSPSPLGFVSLGLTGLLIFAYGVWNLGYRQGITGSSVGKAIMNFNVVGEKTGQPIGFGLSIVRQLAHIVDGTICYIGFLFPLWDAKRQTLADKMMTTVCLPQ